MGILYASQKADSFALVLGLVPEGDTDMTLHTATSRCKRGALAAAMGLVLALPFGNAAASPDISLFGWAINVDGTVANPGGSTAGIDITAFDQDTGLGTILLSLSGAGAHTVLGFFDHEIDEAINTFFNEFGTVKGAPAAGQSWEIDEPGYAFGDIYANFEKGALENTNAVPVAGPDDVSMALGWNLTLSTNESAIVKFVVSEGAPGSGFYLTQTDPESFTSIYLSSNLTITGLEPNIPEPTSLALLGLGLAALAGIRRSKAIA